MSSFRQNEEERPSQEGFYARGRQGAGSRMAEEDRRYIRELAGRVEGMSSRDDPTPPRRKKSAAAQPQRRPAASSVRRQTYPAKRQSAGGGQAAYRVAEKRPPRRRKKTRGWVKALRTMAVVLALLLAGTGILYGMLQRQLDGTATQAGVLEKELKSLPEFKGKEINFLVCGIDYDNEEANAFTTDEKVGRTDMILYVHYNLVDNTASLLQIPRDTFVGDMVETGGSYKINALYYHAKNPDARMQALAEVIYQQFALPVDFYVTLDMDALKAIVDHLGWIRVYVPQTIIDEDYPGSVLYEGWRNLTSRDLEFFLRNRNNPGYAQQGDIARLRTQQAFYAALFRVFKTLSPTDLLVWMKICLAYVKTDYPLISLLSLGQKALSLQGENITFVRPACGSTFYGDVALVSLVAEDMADVLNTYFRAPTAQVPLAELDIQTLYIPEEAGIMETEIKTMAAIQSDEPAEAPG